MSLIYETGNRLSGADDWKSNPVSFLLSMEDRSTSGGKNIPRPFAIRPPLVTGRSELKFGISVFGTAAKYIPHIISAVDALQSIGIGPNRQKFEIKRIQQIDDLENKINVIIQDGKTVSSLIPATGKKEIYAQSQKMNHTTCTVEFLTPTCIIRNRKLCLAPTFRHWFQRLLERIRLLSEHYLSEPIFVPFKTLLEGASKIQIKKDDTAIYGRKASNRYSRNIIGFLGETEYTGDLSELMPYILLGQLIQVGKNTVKGCGWFCIK
jgi:hypothetical protein